MSAHPAGDAGTADPASLARSGHSASGAGEVGKIPWRVIAEHDALAATVKDFDGNELFTASIGVAARACSAVNAHVHLLGINVEMIDVLKALQVQLWAMPPSEAVKRALDLIETTLRGPQ